MRDYVIFLYICSTNIKTYIIMKKPFLSTLSLDELASLSRYITVKVAEDYVHGRECPSCVHLLNSAILYEAICRDQYDEFEKMSED